MPPWSDRVVLGSWGISGAYEVGGVPNGYSQVPAERFDEVLDAAWQAGIRWIDVAPAYGAGEGMRRLADWQRRRDRRWATVVKPGRPVHQDGPRSDITAAGFAEELREIEAILPDPAGVLVKDPPAESFADGRLAALLADLAARGHSTVGIATHRLDLAATLAEPPVPGAVVQLEYHLLNRHIAVPTTARLAANGWRVWGMQPLAYGFLGGQHNAASQFPPDDWRSRIPASVRAAFAAATTLLPGWLPAAVADRPLAEVALAWCLADTALDRVVVGPRSTTQLASVPRAAELATRPELAALIEQIRIA